jgi:hypothetical protein
LDVWSFLLIRPFRLPDALLLTQLQDRGVYLDLKRALLWPPHPGTAAMSTLWPFSSRSVRTFVMDETGESANLVGYLQYRERRERNDADLIFCAPSLQKANGVDAAHIWRQLLTHFIKAVGEHEVQRVYARLLDDTPELDLFWQLGFSAYARSRVYERVHNGEPVNKNTKPVFWRLQRPRDIWAVGQFYSAVTPKLVQLAENMPQSHADAPYREGWGRRWEQRYVWEVKDEVRAALRLIRGENACWLKMLVHPNALEHTDALVQEAISLTPSRSQRIYFSVREYQSELSGAILRAGCAPLATELLMVKHTTVLIKKPVLKPLSVAVNAKMRTTTQITRLTESVTEECLSGDSRPIANL